MARMRYSSASDYYQHLGAILVAQSRRLGLFQHSQSSYATPTPSRSSKHEDEHSKWKSAETRRRLAFGILRGDVFTSVLLTTRPLLSAEELDLFLPHSDKLWHNAEKLTTIEQAITSRMEERHHPRIMFSDLLRTLLERDEIMPELSAVGYELSLFGMQMAIWRFSHDHDQFQRLTGATWSTSTLDASLSTSQTMQAQSSRQMLPSQSPDALGQLHRRMQDLHTDRERVEIALRSWHSGFQAARRSPDFTQNRDSLMSSLLLWHMSHMQLHAPLQQLHDISYRAAESRTVCPELIRSARSWAETSEAPLAATRALEICDLIHNELDRPPERRARFNFLAFGSLHHAAVVLWVVSEADGDCDSARFGSGVQQSLFGGMLFKRDTYNLLQACARLFHNLSPMGGASFGTAAERMSRSHLPTGLPVD